MSTRLYESGSDYIIKSILLKKNGASAQIRNNVVQLEIFENIENPFLTGMLYFKDDSRIFDSISFDGVEECEIIFTQPDKSPNDISKTFIVRSVSDTKKINDLSEAVSLYLLEKIGFDGNLDRFAQSYTGTPLEIINKIARERLNITIDQPSVIPVQKKMKIVIPYMTPLESISFVMERMSTAEGLPYYLFSTLNGKNLKIASLEECLTNPAWNTNSPYRLSTAFTQSKSNHNSKVDPYIVQSYNPGTDTEDTFDLILKGAVGGQFNVFDFTTGRNESKHFDIIKIFSKMESKGIIPKGFSRILETRYGTTNLESMRSLNVHRSIMVNTYENINNYYQEDSLDLYELDMVKKAIKSIMFKSYINLKVPGTPYLTGSNQSIGRQIEYLHMNNNLDASEDANVSEEKIKDKKRSGTYVIFSARHVFYDTRHTTHLSAVKLGDEI